MIRAVLVLVTLPWLAPVAPATGARTEPGPGIDGELLYRVHCASCHGVEAKGQGPMRDSLKVAPTDLTRLRREHDGRFPRNRAREIIDGRGDVPSHGSREMPVWGMTFQELGRAESQESEVRLRIEALLDYLESIQLPTDP